MLGAPANFILRPMKPAKELTKDLATYLPKVRFPMWGSVKYDGIRAMVILEPLTGKPLVVSAEMKPIRSAFVQRNYARTCYLGYDGELIVGDPTDPLCFNKTYSAVMTMGCETPVDFHVFDLFMPYGFAISTSYADRMGVLIRQTEDYPPAQGNIFITRQIPLGGMDTFYCFEEDVVNMGHEGIIIRDPAAPYKFGRSTFREGGLMKVKRFRESECVITGFVELMRNENEPIESALGYTRRSSSKEGKVPAGTLGALEVEDVLTGVPFEIGSGDGLDLATRQKIWDNRPLYLGTIWTYKYFPIGVVDKPRHPILKGPRQTIV